MDSDGTDPKNLSNNPAYDGQPDWSPNGQRIAFMSNRGGDNEIYTMKARPEGERNRPKNLTKNDGVQNYQPNWQPLVN